MRVKPSAILNIPDKFLKAVEKRGYIYIKIRGRIFPISDIGTRTLNEVDCEPRHTLYIDFVGHGMKEGV